MKAKLTATIEGLELTLKKVPDQEVLPCFKITEPGCYTISHTGTVKEPIAELRDVWTKLSEGEQAAFLTGLDVSGLSNKHFIFSIGGIK